MDIHVKNMDMMQYFEEKDQLQRADSYLRVYTLVVELFDEMVDLIGDEQVTIKDYASLIETGLTQIKMGQTPPSVDQIIVGDLSRTRFREVDYVFVLGVNEGKVPLVRASNQLLTDYERSRLLELGLELAPNQEKSLFKEQMNIFMGLTRSRKLLHISYTRVLEEKTERPATLIFLLRKMFPKVTVESAGEIIEDYNKPTRCYALFNRLVRLAGSQTFRSYEKEIQKLYIFFDKAYNEKGKIGINPVQFIEGINYQNQAIKLEPINQDTQSSVSQFETYAGCSYKHFLTYRLGIKERGEYVISMPDIGILFHRCLELYMKKCFMRNIDIHSVTVKLRNQLIEESIKEALDIDNMTIFRSSYRNRYLIVKLTRILKRAIWGIEEQLKRSKFKPKEAEYNFNGRDYPVDNLRLKVSDQHKTYLSGVVDRVDEYETEDTLYFSIVDYKSGSKELDFNLIKEGIQLQLIIYMNVIEEIKAHQIQKKVIPCGMYYYRIQDPMLNINDMDVSDIEDERLKSLKLRGLLLHDEQILRYFDETIDQSSLVVPATLNKNGSISKKSTTIEQVDLGTIKNFVQKKAEEIATDIYEGQVFINPYRYKDETGCDYCQYKSICRFDPTNTTESFHQIKPDSKENIFEEMKGDHGGRSHKKNNSN
jgi:ATP-dependent helicase/nuclease subunit B